MNVKHMKLGNNLKRCRFDKDDMSQQELADAIGVTRQTIIAIESGKYCPSLPLAFKIARAFGKQVEEVFLFEEGSPDSDVTTSSR